MDQDIKAKLDLVRSSLDTVLNANEHEDGKAGRILTAMAFLTAATAAIFAKAYPSNVPPSSASPHVIYFFLALDQLPIDPALLWFILYIGLVILAAGFFLAALGPTFKPFDQPAAHQDVPSIYFFNEIARRDLNVWQNHWTRAINDLGTDATNNLIYETWLTARKTTDKVVLMGWGSKLFRAAIAALAGLLTTLIVSSRPVAGVVGWASMCLLFASFAIENHQRSTMSTAPAEYDSLHRWSIVWAVAAAISVVALFITLVR